MLNMGVLKYRRKCWLFTEKVMAVVEWQCFEEWQTLTQEGIQSLISRFRFVRLVTCRTQLPTKQKVETPILHDSSLCERVLQRSNQTTRIAPSLRNPEKVKQAAVLKYLSLLLHHNRPRPRNICSRVILHSSGV